MAITGHFSLISMKFKQNPMISCLFFYNCPFTTQKLLFLPPKFLLTDRTLLLKNCVFTSHCVGPFNTVVAEISWTLNL